QRPAPLPAARVAALARAVVATGSHRGFAPRTPHRRRSRGPNAPLRFRRLASLRSLAPLLPRVLTGASPPGPPIAVARGAPTPRSASGGSRRCARSRRCCHGFSPGLRPPDPPSPSLAGPRRPAPLPAARVAALARAVVATGSHRGFAPRTPHRRRSRGPDAPLRFPPRAALPPPPPVFVPVFPAAC